MSSALSQRAGQSLMHHAVSRNHSSDRSENTLEADLLLWMVLLLSKEVCLKGVLNPEDYTWVQVFLLTMLEMWALLT